MATRIALYDGLPADPDRTCWLEVVLPSGPGKVVGHAFEVPWYVLRQLRTPPILWIEIMEIDSSEGYSRDAETNAWNDLKVVHYGNGVQGEPTQHKGTVEDCPAPECGPHAED